MVRQVAKRLAGLFCDEKIDVICVLGGPYVGKTWLVSYALEWTNKEYIKVFDNVNTYDEFENLVKQKSQENDKYVIVSRLGLDRCKEIVDGDMAIEYVMVYPMNYREFVLAMPVSFNIYSEELLKIYMMVGGLPEVVNTFIKTGDIDIVRNKQRELFQEMCNELTEKGQKLIYEVIRQELLDSTGFCIRQIANSARDREYARVIEELIGIGITERVKRLVIDADRGVRKYKLNI